MKMAKIKKSTLNLSGEKVNVRNEKEKYIQYFSFSLLIVTFSLDKVNMRNDKEKY